MISSGNDYRKYLEPEVISKLKTLDLKARFIVEGFMVGLHKSPYHGFSAEFSEHRPYMQGDAIKNIDWKVFAKRDKYFIKQFEEETNLISHIFLDVSKSMNYKSSGSVTKLEYAITLAASLLYIIINQQDAAGLVVYSDVIQNYLPPKSNKIYMKKLFTELANVKPSGATNTSECLKSVLDKIKKRGLVIIISDFFDDPESVISAIKKFHYKKNEVIVFQIVDPAEKDFSFERDAVFKDLETGEEMTTLPYQIQKSYIEAFNEFTNKIKKECRSFGVEYNLISTADPFDKALFSYFTKRMRLN